MPFGLWSTGAGSLDPTFYKAVPQKSVEYMFVKQEMDLNLPKRPFYPSLNQKTKAKLGYEVNAYVLQGYGSMYLVKDVLERAASTDRDKIRDAIAATDITDKTCGRIQRKIDGYTYCPPLMRGIPRIRFDQEGHNPYAGYCPVSQIQKGEQVLLSPPGSAMAWSEANLAHPALG